jgi:hypothetical protein
MGYGLEEKICFLHRIPTGMWLMREGNQHGDYLSHFISEGKRHKHYESFHFVQIHKIAGKYNVQIVRKLFDPNTSCLTWAKKVGDGPHPKRRADIILCDMIPNHVVSS